MIRVGQSPNRGRGLFATRDIRGGEVIERSPVIVIPLEEWPVIENTIIGVYVFSWGEEMEYAALALGLGSLFNHSFRPNARYFNRLENNVIEFIAIRDIRESEEVFVNYNRDPEDMTPLWFDVLE
jgi:uncharacterized protein